MCIMEENASENGCTEAISREKTAETGKKDDKNAESSAKINTSVQNFQVTEGFSRSLTVLIVQISVSFWLLALIADNCRNQQFQFFNQPHPWRLRRPFPPLRTEHEC